MSGSVWIPGCPPTLRRKTWRDPCPHWKPWRTRLFRLSTRRTSERQAPLPMWKWSTKPGLPRPSIGLSPFSSLNRGPCQVANQPCQLIWKKTCTRLSKQHIYDIYTYLVWFGMIHPSNLLTLQYPKGPVVRLRHITTAWPLKWLMLLAVARPTQTAIRDIGTALQMDMDNISNICTYMKKKAGLQCLERTFETTCWYILKMDRAS